MPEAYTVSIAASRRGWVGAALAAALLAPGGAALAATVPLLRLATGPRGSGAERYGAALCASLPAEAALRLAPRHALGSVESLHLLDQGQVQFACASLSAAVHGWAGTGGFARRLRRLRVLAPIYGLPVLLRAPDAARLGSWRGLDGRHIGCGPAGGAAEAVLRATMPALGVAPEVVVDQPAALGALLRDGRLDAVLVAGGQDASGFGAEAVPLLPMAPDEQARLAAALPGLAPAMLPGPGGEAVPGLAAWTLLLAQAGLAEAWAEPVTTLALAWPAALRAALPAGVLPGAGPEANPALPWHGGAYAAWKRAGVVLPEPAP